MKLQLISRDSPFVASIKSANDLTRLMIDQGHRSRNSADDLLDNEDLLAELVSCCFWASLETDEGRPPRGSICICSPAEAAGARSLLKPVPITESALLRLLTASPESALAVNLVDSTLVIWGLLKGVPARPRVKILGVGALASCDSFGRATAILRKGEVHIPKFDKVGTLQLVSEALGKEATFPSRMQKVDRFLRIVSAIRRCNHGGALVVIPVGAKPIDMGLDVPYEFDSAGAALLAEHQAELNEATTAADRTRMGIGRPPSGSPEWIPLEQEQHCLRTVERDLRLIAQLGAIDGAIVMNEELWVLGFAAKLEGQEGAFLVASTDLVTSVCENVGVEDLGGTRHQSAARFVQRHNDAMVFVASQDGRITLFVWVQSPGQVLAIRGMEYFAAGD